MGNSTSKSYDINNSALQSGKSRKYKMSSKNDILQKFSCNKKNKYRAKDKTELVKSPSWVPTLGAVDGDLNEFNGDAISNHNSITPINMIQDIHCSSNNAAIESKENSNNNLDMVISDRSVNKATTYNISRNHQRLSEISINSDDLMLSTDVNLDQADDDVSKDYNANEKDDPFITSLNDINQKMNNDNCSQGGAEDSERNDIVFIDSSRESSVSLQRKISGRGNGRRPHSFSTPLHTDGKFKTRRSSNLSTVESVDLAWTWMSASESANVVQEISNLKLMLLKMRRLLLDDFNNDLTSNGSVAVIDNDQNIFSEPGTPIYYNDQNRTPNTDSENQASKCWSDMDKESLIQELREADKRNKFLQCKLNDKNRIIELLQEKGRRFQRPHARTEPVISRIARSSTFDSSIIMTTLSPSTDSASFTNTYSGDSKILKSELKNIDSGLYQSGSSTESCLYQN